MRSCDGVVHIVGPTNPSLAGDRTESDKRFGRIAPRHPSVDEAYARSSDTSGGAAGTVPGQGGKRGKAGVVRGGGFRPRRRSRPSAGRSRRYVDPG